jgi:hypothetical protein
MVVKWIREKSKGWMSKLIINTIGAMISFIVSMMFFLTKFSQVWPVLVFLPLIIYLFHRIRKHYVAVGHQLRLETSQPAVPIQGNVIILPVAGITRVVENSLNYAKSLSQHQIIAVYVPFEREEEAMFEEKWHKWQPDVRLVTLHSPYRSIINPLTKFIDTVQRKAAESNYQVTVIIPQFIPRKGWHNILHNQTSLLIRAHLLYRRNVIVTTVPYRLME